MFTNKTDLLIGLAAGIVAGAVGYLSFKAYSWGAEITGSSDCRNSNSLSLTDHIWNINRRR